MKNKLNINDLPIKELEQIGLYSNGEIKLNSLNIQALLQGKRTELIRLELRKGNDSINLQAKLSYINNILKIHPIYKEPQLHPLLSAKDASLLIHGRANIIVKNDIQNMSLLFVEYDAQTREFISFNPQRIPKIVEVNHRALSKLQQEFLAKGELVQLHDGTQIQYSAQSFLKIHTDKSNITLTINDNNKNVFYHMKFPEQKNGTVHSYAKNMNPHNRNYS